MVCRYQFYYKICLISWDLLGALSTKGPKACDDRDIFQSCYSEVLGGKSCMLLGTPVLISCSPLLWLQHKCNLILVLKRKTLRFVSAFNFVFYLWQRKSEERGKMCSFYNWWLLVSHVPLRLPQFLAVTQSLQTWNFLKFSCDLTSIFCKVVVRFFLSICSLVSDLRGQQKSRLELHQLGKSSRGSYKRN